MLATITPPMVAAYGTTNGNLLQINILIYNALGSAEWHSPIVFVHLHAADVTALFVATENTTRPSGKLHVCSCPTSLQNFDNFSAEVARLHCSSFLHGLLSGGRLQERFQDFAVCSVDGHGVQRGEVDACGVLGVVSHAFADDGQWYVFAPGDACPGVSADVHGEGYG